MNLNYHSVRYLILRITLKLLNSTRLANFVSELNNGKLLFRNEYNILINDRYQMFFRKLMRKSCFPKELKTIVRLKATERNLRKPCFIKWIKPESWKLSIFCASSPRRLKMILKKTKSEGIANNEGSNFHAELPRNSTWKCR